METNNRGQNNNPLAWLSGAFALIVLVIMTFLIIDAFTKDKCAPFMQQAETCRNDVVRLTAQLNLSEEKYLNLTNTNVTKKDIVDILNELNRTQIEVNYVKNELVNVNNNVVSNFHALIFNFTWSIVINVTLLSFAFIDLTLLAFNIDLKKKIAEWLRRKINGE